MQAQIFYAYRQAQLDSLPILAGGNPAYLSAIVLGYPDTSRLGTSDIHDLSVLSSIQFLTDGLVIRNEPRLKTLAGLEHLKEVGGLGIRIENCDSLSTLVALDSLTYTGDFIEIYSNAGLTALDGFNALQKVYHLRVGGNHNLTQITGFQKLKYVEQLSFGGNALTSLKFPMLNTVLDILMNGENELTNFGGLESVDTMGTTPGSDPSMVIYVCKKLRSFAGLNPTVFRGGRAYIHLYQNPVLEDLTALSEWPLDSFRFRAEGNPNLHGKLEFKYPKNAHEIYITSSPLLDTLSFPALESAYRLTAYYLDSLRYLYAPNLVYLRDSLLLNECDNIQDLSGLGKLEYAGNILLGNLKSIKNLHGLEKLKEVGRSFLIFSHTLGALPIVTPLDSLTALCQFEQFEKVGLYISIDSARNLTNLDGLETFKKTSAIWLLRNTTLTDLKGLANLDTLEFHEGINQIEGSVNLYFVPVNDLSVFDDVSFPRGASIWIRGCDSLQTFSFPSVKKLLGFSLRNNDRLHDFSFPNLMQPAVDPYNYYKVNIAENASLQTLDGLKTYKYFPINLDHGFRITSNPSLTDCDAICILRQTIATIKFLIEDNAFPCGSLEEIDQYVCDSLSSVENIFTHPATAQTSNLLVWPNPTADAVHFRGTADIRFSQDAEVFDAVGRRVLSVQISDPDFPMYVGHLPDGFYWLHLRGTRAWGRFTKCDR